MANYTETLKDYLDGGGQLPPIMETIVVDGTTTFATLFANYYYFREIGMEEENMFYQSLCAYATTYLPTLKIKLAKEGILMGGLDANTQSSTTSANGGNKNYENPIDSINDSNALESSSKSESNGTSTVKVTGGDFAITMLSRMSEYKSNVTKQMLDVFENCFMGVY